MFGLMRATLLVPDLPAQNNPSTHSFQVCDITDAFTKGQTIFLSKFCSEIEYVRLETRPDIVIERVDIIDIGEKFIVIADTKKKETFLFMRNGRFIRKLGKTGDQQGEFSSIKSLSLSLNERWVALFDFVKAKVILYSTDNEQVRELAVSGGASEVIFGSGSYLLASYTYPLSAKNTNHQFSWIDITDGGIKPFATVPNPVRTWESIGIPVCRIKNELFVDQLYNDTIYSINPAGYLEPRFYFEIQKIRIPAESFRNRELFAKNASGYARCGKWTYWGNWVLINAWYGKQVKHIVYDIKKSTVFSLIPINVYRNMAIDNDLDGGPPFWFDAVTLSGNPVQLVYPRKILEFQKGGFTKEITFQNASAAKLFRKLLSEINENDNPILQILKMPT
jgi:hypothetical protein